MRAVNRGPHPAPAATTLPNAGRRATRPAAPGAAEGTLREPHRGHARPRAAIRRPRIPSACRILVPAASRACPRFPPCCSMVRRGLRFESGRGLSGRRWKQLLFQPGRRRGFGTSCWKERRRGGRRIGRKARAVSPQERSLVSAAIGWFSVAAQLASRFSASSLFDPISAVNANITRSGSAASVIPS
jgi:hypothetical protein